MTKLEEFGIEINRSKNRIREIEMRSLDDLNLSLTDLSDFKGLNMINYSELKSLIGPQINQYGSKRFKLTAQIILEDIQVYFKFYKNYEDELSDFKPNIEIFNLYSNSAKEKAKVTRQSWKELSYVRNSLDSVQFSPILSEKEINEKLQKLKREESRLTKEYEENSLQTQKLYELADVREKELINYNIEFKLLYNELTDLYSELNRYISTQSLKSSIPIFYIKPLICATYLPLFQEVTKEQLSEEKLTEILNLVKNENKDFTILENNLEKFYLILIDLSKFLPKELKINELEWLEKIHQAFGEKLKSTFKKGQKTLSKGKDPIFIERLKSNFEFLSDYYQINFTK